MSGAGQAFDISRVLVSEEVRQIRREGWTGVLALAQGDIAKGLYFMDGEIVFAASTVEEDRLGANLYRIGRITEPQFRAAMTAAQTPGRRLGQALIDAGVLKREELAAAVEGQAERIALSVLRWTSGRLQRRAMERPLPADLILELKTGRLLLLGARLFPNPRRLEVALGGPGTRLRRVAIRPFAYDQLPTSSPERAVLALSARETTLGDALSLPHPRDQLLRAVYGLVASGMVETHEAAPAAPEAPEEIEVEIEVEPAAEPALEPGSALGEVGPAFEAGPADDEVGSEPDAPPSPDTGEQRARSLLERGQRQAAVELLTTLVEMYPDAHGCRRLLAMTLAQAGSFQKDVESHCLAALEMDSKDTELRHRLATYYRRAGMTARAMLQLRKILSDDPGHAGAWRDLGELEAAEGKRGR
ncbi:MAG: tetratricopeptide repeat protein [Acidobacteria bacterium]|nr:tetratricopeptide repeat protein [Acidobacteriota bacterium]